MRFSVFGIGAGENTLSSPQMLVARGDRVFSVVRREFYNYLRVKRCLPFIGERLFWSQTLQRIDRPDGGRTGAQCAVV